MREMRFGKRLLSMLLAIVMIVGILPASVLAAEKTVEGEFSGSSTVLDAAIFCSDVHGSTSDLESVLAGVATSGVNYSSIGFVGDTCLTVSNTTSIVQSELSDTDISVMFSYASSHDDEDGADISTNWNYSGEVEGVSDYYLVYTIRETDMQNASGASTAAPAFTTWYNGLTAAQKALPIFILSHRPLHDRRDDNAGAATWYTAISAAAKTSDIVFFWGHNHTSESSVDTAAYYVAKNGDETLTVYNGDTVVPNFTYMNAGYINANNQNPARLGVATTVQITADALIFQDYNSSGKYTGTYAHNVTVKRDCVQVPKTLAVTGKIDYTVNSRIETPTEIVVTYSDHTTDNPHQDVLTEGTASLDNLKLTKITAEDGTELDVDTFATFTATGTYNLTYTYTIGTYQAQAVLEVTVEDNTPPTLNSISVTTQPTKLAYAVGEELDTTGMVVTGTYSDGSTAELAGWYTSAVDMTTAGEKTVTVNYVVDSITFKTTFTITVEEAPAEGVVLEKIEINQAPDKTEYLISQELALGGMVVFATFSDGSTVELQYKPFSTSAIYGGYELYNFSMYVEKAHELTVVYTYGDVTCYDTTTINVWNEDFADENTGVKVHVAAGDYGVTDLNVSPSANSNVAAAVKNFIKEGTLVAYDITLTLDADVDAEGNAVYALTNGEKTVTLPIPSGVTNPVVYYVSDDGTVVQAMNATKDGNGNVTFTTTHFSTYVIGESTEITVPDNVIVEGSTTTGGKKTVYLLTSNISDSNSYLIVNGNSAGAYYALANNSGSVAATGVTIKSGDVDGDGDTEIYIELDDATDELWTVDEYTQSGGYGGSTTYYRFQNGIYYLSGSRTGSTYYPTLSNSATNWTWASGTSNGTAYNRLSARINSNTRYLYYSDGWALSQSTQNIYFYVPQEIDTTTTVSGTYSIEGDNISQVVTAGSTATLSSTLTFDITDGEDLLTENPAGVTYEIVTKDINGNTVDGDPADIIKSIEDGVVTFTGNYGTALVKVSYDVTIGGETKTVTDYITVEAKSPYYSIQLHKAELTALTDEQIAAGVQEGVNYYIFNSTTGNYQSVTITAFEDGVTYYTTPVKSGAEITAPIALKGVKAGDTYSVWAIVKQHTGANPDGVDMGALGDALHWSVSDESVATIDATTGVITFTGNNYGTIQVTVSYTGTDGKVITDTITISVTESLYVVPGDGTNDFPEYPNEGAVRFDKTATAVGNFSETGIAKVEISMTGVPYTTGNAIDVLLMLDMSTSMDTEVADGVDRVDVTITAAKAFAKTIVQNDDGTYNSNKIAIKYFNGSSVYTTTDYITVSSDAELEALYTMIESLYTPTSSGTYYSTAMKNAYDTIIAQDAVSDNTQALVFMSDGGPTYYTYVNGTSYATVSNSPSTIVGWFDVDDKDTTDETDDTATPNSSFKTEYYSYLLKQAGYPVYTVGLGLSNNSTGPSAFTGLTSGAHEAITSYILSSMATNSSYFYSVADSDAVANMGNIFSGIAASIKEAARDVVVEDKIGNNYNINLSLPEGLTSVETDGLSEFYIQVVDYVLDSTTHQRTGVYSVLENFTFNADGTLKSHTVDGVACSSCDHVVTDNGTITAINGTYFTYKNVTGSDDPEENGEYLHWEADKITSTELALQYFAYLENSAGTDVENQIPAGTYYTNEYATLTYTNVYNKVVQQEFPVPQMTWNGAQVSYVFYLVNDAGQPVNRAGRVVPMAEAVYVTDVFTYSVVWNDMEQAAGLYANYLAENLVPDVYALYDDDASYQIHVYEKETEVNLNNHFVIGGDVTDAYNNTWTNAKTTYVFNNKSDATKYNSVGAYVANDGDTTLNETGLPYFCKSAIIEGATYTTSVENGVNVYTVTSVGNGYQKVDGETQTTVTQIEAAGGSTNGGTTIDGYIYYVDENGDVYTIVTKTDGKEVEKGFDFSNTTVAFAVVWKPRLETDTVVVDFGLDVVINVSMNDNLASGVVGVLGSAPENGAAINSGTYSTDGEVTTSVDVKVGDIKVGTASVESLTSVRFSFDKDNAMLLNQSAIFYYESDCNYYTYDDEGKATLNTKRMYSSVIVIPASTVYYEDEYVDLSSYTLTETQFDENGKVMKDENGKLMLATKTKDEISSWVTEGTVITGTQACDRPGFDMISEAYDANNVYGYDAVYDTMSKYSMGSAAKITVSSTKSGEASFTFYGTGFDIIGLTSNTTGTLMIDVYAGASATGTPTTYLVDTYYGYTLSTDDLNEDGELNDWVVSDNTPNALYQVPVMKVSGLTYGQYTVVLTASYGEAFDHTDAGSYDLYLDAVRIYDPVKPETVVGTDAEENGDDVTIEDIYAEDNEGWPVYEELRNNIIAASGYAVTENEDGTVAVTGDNLSGAIFIDCNDATNSIADYVSYGPNNELYLAKNQAIAFNVAVEDYIYTDEDGKQKTYVDDIQIGIKLANGSKATYEINGTEHTVESSTDMYYSILEYAMDDSFKAVTVTIKNTGDAILSLTNIKVTYTCDPATIPGTTSLLSMDAESAGVALMMLRRAPVVEEETVPEETIPEEVVPEAPVIFTPDKLHVSLNKNHVKQGDKVKVTVKTSADVAYLTVNGETVTEYKSNRRSGERTWTVTLEADEAGEMTVEVIAYSAEDVASEVEQETVTVQAKKNGRESAKEAVKETVETVKEVVKGILGWLFG